MSIYYLDYENGDDVNDGSDWANAWKTITFGATAARIVPGDIIRIAKSPAPTSIGNGTWTNLSKTVTLATAGTAVIDLCETAWTAAGDCTVTRTAVATNAKEGSYCMKLAIDAAVQASILQAYFATGELDLSGYQKISFWIYNSGVIVADNWIVNLCSDVAGADVVDSFLIPAIPSYNRWVPLTLVKEGGGNLGASIKSIAIYSGGTITGMASKYIYVDDFIACTTNGLNLQSLISKNSAEQGGAEGWYGIQSIDGVTVLLDNDPMTKGNAGRGYSTAGTTPDTVTTYKRETIKTALSATSTVIVQQIMDSGTFAADNIEFQGGYNISNSEQDGETFFDGLNGYGFGIYATGKSYITINRLNVSRYNRGFNFVGSCGRWLIDNLSNANNNADNGLCINTGYCFIINNIGNVNNNGAEGISLESAAKLLNVYTISNVNNNLADGLDISSNCNWNRFTLISNALNNGHYGVSNVNAYDNRIRSLLTANNVNGGVNSTPGSLYITSHALLNETTKVAALPSHSGTRVYLNNYEDGINNQIFAYGGLINSEVTDRDGGTGLMWKLAITSNDRNGYYPLKLSIAKIAVVANKLVTVNAYMKKSHATNVEAMLVCPGGQLTGMTVANITDTKADDADTWEELEVTFTPTQAGVVEIEVWAYYLAANGDVYVEDMTITQAD